VTSPLTISPSTPALEQNASSDDSCQSIEHHGKTCSIPPSQLVQAHLIQPTPHHPTSAETPQTQPIAEQNGKGLAKEMQVFFSTFITIFLAELGDKTQVTTLLMSAESHAPWVVFAGAGTALVATSLIGVMVGHWLSKRVSQRTLEVAAAILLLTVALLLIGDVVWV
jgi:putative Ca2+/H+ antiporter (TMEM165/GDT1 family)